MKRFLAITIILSFMLSMIFVPASYALGEVLSKPLIIKLGDDKAIDYTVEKILVFAPTVSVISINDLNALKSTSLPIAGYIIYVGHGAENGLLIGDNLVSWNDVKNVIQNSPSSYMIAACYSKAGEIEGKATFSFPGKVDVDSAAMWAVIQYYSYSQQYES